jgi:hypothetical protein
VSDRKRSLSEKQRVEPVAYHEEAAGAFASIALFFITVSVLHLILSLNIFCFEKYTLVSKLGTHIIY